MPIVSFELCDETQFSIHIQRVMQPQCSTQLTYAQMPLKRFGIVWESKSLLPLLPEWNGFAQAINELKGWGEEWVSQPNISLWRSDSTNSYNFVSPERVGQERAGGGIFSGQWCSRVCLQTFQKTAPLAPKVHLVKGTEKHERVQPRNKLNATCFCF